MTVGSYPLAVIDYYRVVSSTTNSEDLAPILFFFTQILAMGTVSPSILTRLTIELIIGCYPAVRIGDQNNPVLVIGMFAG
jgi:hypothetical protein